MDGSTVEHSDSDSGDSWTLLENNPTYGDEAPDFPENIETTNERYNIEAPSEKDEDTDGISIISDSDPESTPCEAKYDKSISETYPTDETTPLLPLPTNNSYNQEPTNEETDFLGDNIKFKTYVHKRNPKVGSILDIIMLGTFVITAGMALGHLWSCKNECTTQTSVNKILSNLYKLQEENAYLRNKLKEITLTTGYQLSGPRKSPTDTSSSKQHRCKKRFEEPLIKNRLDGAVKCVDDKPDIFQHPLPIPEHEKEFLNDVNKMKNIYDLNKVWIDKEVKKQFDMFEKLKNNKDATEHNAVSHKQINLTKQLGGSNGPLNKPVPKVLQDTQIKKKGSQPTGQRKRLGPVLEVPIDSEPLQSSDNKVVNVDSTTDSASIKVENNESSGNEIDPVEMVQEKKITYADSLKMDQPMQKSQRNDNVDSLNRYNKDHIKRKHKNDDILLNLNSFSEDDIKKDDRYTGPKIKHEKKKHDRQKSHKKQKRNKYEQWEMKGGYLRDYDEFSVTSSQDNDIFVQNPDRKFLNPDFENYINKVTEMENNASNNKDQPKITKKIDDKAKVEKRSMKNIGKKKKNKDSEWFDKRTALRAEARMKLEQELFGENTSNNAAWYFRRMQKREQCRAQKDNSTFKKFSKKKMNFKMKR